MFGDEPALAPLCKKLVLYPQGYPRTHRARAICAELVHHCGGDSQRTFDLKRSTPAHTLDHAGRIRAFQDPRRASVCVVHDTVNLEDTLTLRTAFESNIPVASSAVWALYWDPDLDPEFLTRIDEHGVLTGDLREGATFRHRSGVEFLVLSPLVDDLAALADEAALMAMARSPKRLQRPSRSRPSVKVQLAS